MGQRFEPALHRRARMTDKHMKICWTSLIIWEKQIKITVRGNSLVVQWLGLCAFTAEDPGSIPVRGTKILQAVQHGQKTKQNKKKPWWEKISHSPDWQKLKVWQYLTLSRKQRNPNSYILLVKVCKLLQLVWKNWALPSKVEKYKCFDPNFSHLKYTLELTHSQADKSSQQPCL